jgi:diguanylate cyclase (GGDEF)-like protein
VYGLTRVASAAFLRNLLAVALVSFAGAAGAADTTSATAPGVISLTTDESVRIPSLSTSIQLLEDVGGRLDIADVSHAPLDTGFVAASPATTNVGFSKSAWWARLALRNDTDEPRLVYLRQGYPLIDSLTLFEPTTDGGWRRHDTGDRRPFSSRNVAHRDFLFPLHLEARGEHTYYLRYASQGPVDIHLSLVDSTGLAEALSREQLAYGLYFGCVLMLLVWSGLVFVAVRDPAFFAYFAYVSTFGVYMTVNTGFAFQYFWPDSPRWANSCLIMLLSLALVTALQFSTTILRSRDYTPRLNTVARGLQVLALLGIVLVPFLEYATLVKPVALLIFVSVIFMIALGIFSLLAGSRPARYYVIAWGAFLAGSVIFLMKNFGVVPHTFISQHSWQVGALVEMILLSMTLSSRMNELKHQSRTDPITLLGNRRLFDDRLPLEFTLARSEGRPLSLLMIDIDNFKNYNDRHGHALGDEAIKLVGAALRRHARKPVLACRYGGDEFCVILPGAGADTAAMVAERVRANVQAARADALAITVSVGYATLLNDEFPSHDKLFDAADAALYSAKEAGRNRVAAFSGRRADDNQRSSQSS